MPYTRHSYEVMFDQAPKWIIRGVLYNAPYKLRSQYTDIIKPLELGGTGISENNKNGPSAKEERVIEQLLLDLSKLIKGKPLECWTDEEIEQQVQNSLSFANDYLKNTNLIYYKNDLKTITQNVSKRNILSIEATKKRYHQHSRKADYNGNAIIKKSEIKMNSEIKRAIDIQRTIDILRKMRFEPKPYNSVCSELENFNPQDDESLSTMNSFYNSTSSI